MADSKQREIKFRLIKDGKIVGYESLAPIEDGTDLIWVYSVPGHTEHSNLVPTIHDSKDQFTGLQDRNGKDIFEGDIVESEAIRASLVLFAQGSFCFHPDLPVTAYFAHYPDSKLKIIGNIHENPELLKGSND